MNLLNKSPVYVKVDGNKVLSPGEKLPIVETRNTIITCELGSGYAEIVHRSDGKLLFQNHGSGLTLSEGQDCTIIIR